MEGAGDAAVAVAAAWAVADPAGEEVVGAANNANSARGTTLGAGAVVMEKGVTVEDAEAVGVRVGGQGAGAGGEGGEGVEEALPWAAGWTVRRQNRSQEVERIGATGNVRQAQFE